MYNEKVKMILTIVLLCAVSFAGYSVNNYFTTPAEKLMNANVQALTRSEGGSGGGAYSCKKGFEASKGFYVECDGHKTYC